MRFEFLSSTPATPTEGSGTWVAIDGLVRGLERLGHTVGRRPLGLRTRFHTLDRWLYNAAVAADPPRADVVLGVDLDGFLWARRRRGGARAFVVALKGIIADELRNERGLVRALLGIQARWERRNTERADRVIVPSHYLAGIIRGWGIDETRICVVPNAVSWATVPPATTNGHREAATLLTAARLAPWKGIDRLLQSCDHRMEMASRWGSAVASRQRRITALTGAADPQGSATEYLLTDQFGRI